MKQYHIVLSEEEIDLIIHDIQFSINNDQGNELSNSDRGEVITNLMVAKEKPYTNFERIKNEMTIEDLCKEQVCEIIVKTSKVGKEWCKNKFKQFEGECPERGCEDCCKKWLESETNSELFEWCKYYPCEMINEDGYKVCNESCKMEKKIKEENFWDNSYQDFYED